MQPTFPALRVLPPPAAGAFILARFDGPRAWRAADARVAAIVQRVVRDAMRFNVGPDVVARPIRQRIELGDAVQSVEFFDGDCAPGDRLPAAQAGDPRLLAGKRARKGLSFAYRAATLAQQRAFVERIDPMRAHERLECRRVREINIDVEAGENSHAARWSAGRF